MTVNRPIPFVDLVTPHVELQDELVAAFTTAIRSAAFIGGPAVEGFEREFAEFCDAKHCVDVDAKTYTLDPALLRQYMETKCALDTGTGRYVHRTLGKPVTAVIPVHLYGQTADMDPILEVAEQFGLVVIEDACQAHGAEYFSKTENRWRKAGSMGHAAAFSFYPGKNLGACGEAGAVTTDDQRVARHCQMLRDHGQSRKYFHDFEGYNGRLDAMQAGVLGVKLRHLPTWNDQRRRCAHVYDELFASADGDRRVETPYVPTWSRPVYHLYVVRVANRE